MRQIATLHDAPRLSGVPAPNISLYSLGPTGLQAAGGTRIGLRACFSGFWVADEELYFELLHWGNHLNFCVW